MTDPAPWPAFPATLTNGALYQYALDLQTTIKIDANKLEQIGKLQPKAVP